jgi:hypothetical protein
LADPVSNPIAAIAAAKAHNGETADLVSSMGAYLPLSEVADT